MNKLIWIYLHKGESMTKCTGVEGLSPTPRPHLKGTPYLSLPAMYLLEKNSPLGEKELMYPSQCKKAQDCFKFPHFREVGKSCDDPANTHSGRKGNGRGSQTLPWWGMVR